MKTAIIILGIICAFSVIVFIIRCIKTRIYVKNHSIFSKRLTGGFDVSAYFSPGNGTNFTFEVKYDGHTYTASPLPGNLRIDHSFVTLTVFDDGNYWCSLFLTPKDARQIFLKVGTVTINIPEIESNKVLANS